MQKKLVEEMFRQEETYWWHVAKRRLVQAEIYKKFPNKAPTILDVGCGTGAMLRELTKFTPNVYGVDITTTYSKKRGLKNITKADLEKGLPYASSSFDCITCLDVLEHVANDKKLVSEFNRILKKGGSLMLTVPAYQFLWTYWDEILGHRRRYRKSKLVSLLKTHGFLIIKDSYFYSFLIPVAIAFRYFKTLIKNNKSDFVEIPQTINNLLLSFCTLERNLMGFIKIPMGLSIFIEAEKK